MVWIPQIVGMAGVSHPFCSGVECVCVCVCVCVCARARLLAFVSACMRACVVCVSVNCLLVLVILGLRMAGPLNGR